MPYNQAMTTILEAVERYLATVARSRSPRTARAYRNGLNLFLMALAEAGVAPDSAPISSLSEGSITLLIERLADLSPATENLYLTAASGFYHFLAAEQFADPNLPRLRSLIRQRARKQGRRLPKFPREEIERLIAYAQNLNLQSVESIGDQAKTEAGRLSERKRARLRNLRDRAFILFLADTGLRVSEACSLTLGDVDFLEGRLTVLGKGDQQAIVRISRRALAALKDYLEARRTVQQPTGRKAKSLPLFTRHDRGSGSVPRRLDPSSAWDLVKARAREAVGEAADQIHPHSFRHYFVTVVLLATNNMEKTRRLARHKSITVTQRYAEIDPELDQDYYEIFDARKN